jgi:hypothetical protein
MTKSGLSPCREEDEECSYFVIESASKNDSGKYACYPEAIYTPRVS